MKNLTNKMKTGILTNLPEKSNQLIFLSLPGRHRFWPNSKSLIRIKKVGLGKYPISLWRETGFSSAIIQREDPKGNQVRITPTGTRGSGRYSSRAFGKVENEQEENPTLNVEKKSSANFAKPLRLIAMVILLLLSYTTSAQTITQYQQEAAENNPGLKAKYQQYLSALEESPIVGTLPDPEVSFSYFIKPIETRVGPQQGRISVSQMLPWFGSLQDQRSVSDLRAKAKFESFQESRNRIFLQVEQTLLQLYELHESIRIAEENRAILNSLVELSLARYETDRATQVDVLRAQIEEEGLNIQIELLKDNRNVLLQKMNELLNRNEGTKITLPDSLGETDIKSREDLMAQIEHQNPNLNRLRYQEASSEVMKSLAQKQNRPGIKLGVDYIFTGETDMPNITNSGEDALMVMAGLRVPIFGKKNNAKVQQAERNIQDVQYQISSRENSLQTELDTSLRDYKDAQRRFKLYNEKQIQRITQAINIMMDAYSSDSSEFEEILRMQRKQLEYQLKRIQAKTEQHKAKAYIRYLSGEHNVSQEL
ncbi:TolC family protein [Gracilimonas sp.]|uniref:TolC family protein n=1 Tax=Gracilimonas sp. TaxID=1974203 RepID=UPI0028718F23|nr:TolC family protein [Gracilimonas sp.]